MNRASVASFLPPLHRGAVDDVVFARDIARYSSESDLDLLKTIKICLSNVDRLKSDVGGADAELRIVLVPELCERLVYGQRSIIRHVTTTLAEYEPTGRAIERVLATQFGRDLVSEATELRKRIALASVLSTPDLCDQVRFAIAGSAAADRWPPTMCVYEPAFTYRVVPVLAVRVLRRYRERQWA